MPPQNPLTEQDKEEIDKALETVKEAQELIETSQRAGIDVAEFRARATDARDKLLRIKAAFFPGQ